MIAVSVITPFYNSADCIAKTLESIRSQTLKNIEIICVDDGSSDGSADIVKRVAVEDRRMKYIRQDNGGAGTARNNGIRHATGEYVAFMDSDDMYPRDDALELLYRHAVENGASICGGTICDLAGNAGVRQFNEEGLQSFYDHQCDFWFSRFIYRRSLLVDNECWFPPYRYYEDPVFLLRAMSIAKEYYAIREPVYLQLGAHTSSKALSLDQLKDYAKGIIDNLSYSIEYGYAEIYKSCVKILQYNFNAKIEECIMKDCVDDELLALLMRLNAIVANGAIVIDNERIEPLEIINALKLIWNLARNYVRLRNTKLGSVLVAIKRRLKLSL